MEPSFISEKCMFWIKNIIIYYLQRPATEMHSFLMITFFSYFNLCYFIYL
jgi:hypothetical protein